MIRKFRRANARRLARGRSPLDVFRDDDTGTEDGDGEPGSGEPKGEPTAGGSQGLTEERVNAIIQERLQRQDRKRSKELATRLKKLGIEVGDDQDPLDALDGTLAEREAARKKALEDKGEFAKLLEEERAEKQKLLDERDAELQRLKGERRDSAKREALRKAASNAHSPDEVATLLWNEVEVDDETGALFVIDEKGQKRTDGKGNFLTVDAYVGAWLNERKHHLKPASGKGANSGPNTGGGDKSEREGVDPELGFDPVRAKNDTEYYLKHRAKILAAWRAGKLD